ncbi:OmpA family protein [Rudanella lutea]|uniref:OmpA family protein n=1 Tax=Rudanella lutea TaxID=451374 RepID=UPI0003651949|nr:OmpA family protein [Rudanella lutea]
MKNSCIVFLLVWAVGMAWAQTPPARVPNRSYDGDYPLNTWSISVTPQLTRFFGDLSYGVYRGAPELGEKEILTGGVGLAVNKQLSHLFGVSVQANGGMLSGSKKPIYNAYFRTNYLQGAMLASVNVKSLLLGAKRLKRLKWDVYGGIGGIWFDARVYDLTTNRLIRYSNDRDNFSSVTSGRWEGDGSVFTRELVVPIGTAVHYELSPRFDIGLDFVYNNVNTEKLDMTVGSTDPAYNNNPANIYLFRKGESALDKYGAVGLSITYKLGRTPLRVGRDGRYDADKGRYHLRWADPANLVKPAYNPSVTEADSIAKANMPQPADPRLYTDSDNDGVADLFDKQPRTPAGSVVSGAGVAMNLDSLLARPKTTREAGECVDVFSNVEFDTDKATLRPTSQTLLRQVTELLNERPNCRAIVVGHADARASDAYNVQLSKRRVEAVKRFMTRAGLNDPSRITLEYYGEIRPAAPNSTRTGLQANRRVEIRIEPMSDMRSRYPAGFRK